MPELADSDEEESTVAAHDWQSDPYAGEVFKSLFEDVGKYFNMHSLHSSGYYQRQTQHGNIALRKARIMRAIDVGLSYGLWTKVVPTGLKTELCVKQTSAQIPNFREKVLSVLTAQGITLKHFERAAKNAKVTHSTVKAAVQRLNAAPKDTSLASTGTAAPQPTNLVVALAERVVAVRRKFPVLKPGSSQLPAPPRKAPPAARIPRGAGKRGPETLGTEEVLRITGLTVEFVGTLCGAEAIQRSQLVNLLDMQVAASSMAFSGCAPVVAHHDIRASVSSQQQTGTAYMVQVVVQKPLVLGDVWKLSAVSGARTMPVCSCPYGKQCAMGKTCKHVAKALLAITEDADPLGQACGVPPSVHAKAST